MPLIPYFLLCPRCGFEGSARPFIKLTVLQKLALAILFFIGVYFVFGTGSSPLSPWWVDWIALLGFILLIGIMMYFRWHQVAVCPACGATVWNFFWLQRQI